MSWLTLALLPADLLTDKTIGAGHVAIILDGSTYRERCISSRCDFAIDDWMHDARVGAGPVSALKDPSAESSGHEQK
jgi:hypothetical protein